MQAWFSTTPLEKRLFTETDIRETTNLLQRTSSRDAWSRIPRIYIVLRVIDRLEHIKTFIAQGITDVWFPFSQTSLPQGFQPLTARLDFIEAQSTVCNKKALNLERGTGHGHFRDATEVPLRKIGELGKGAYGFVDRVVSTISHREYARKLIPRGRTFKRDQAVLRAFERELSNLKKLSQHRHIVKLVASYTDPKYVGIIMSPVADTNLANFLRQSLKDEGRSCLRTFFGCLTSALGFLHNNRIRHKDIKPANVLVKSSNVFLTDFGISLDWSGQDQSTTTGTTFSTPRYCAPEVANHSARNSLADIWSLGCVFLEIWTVLKCDTTTALEAHMRSNGTMTVS